MAVAVAIEIEKADTANDRMEALQAVPRHKEPEMKETKAPVASGFMQNMFSCAACACTENMPCREGAPVSGVPLEIDQSRDMMSETLVQQWASGPPIAFPSKEQQSH